MRRFRLTPLRLAAAVAVGAVACTGVAYAASLGIASSGLFAWSQTLTKATCPGPSMTEDDTFVDQGNISANNGTQPTLSINGAANHNQYAFIRFDLSGCGIPTTGGADSATLKIVVNAHSNDTISLFPVYSSWTGAGLNWSNYTSLSIGSTATTSFVPSTNTAFTLTVTGDVDAAIKAGTLWGWELKDTSGTATTKIDSGNNGTATNRPTLTLSYEK